MSQPTHDHAPRRRVPGPPQGPCGWRSLLASAAAHLAIAALIAMTRGGGPPPPPRVIQAVLLVGPPAPPAAEEPLEMAAEEVAQPMPQPMPQPAPEPRPQAVRPSPAPTVQQKPRSEAQTASRSAPSRPLAEERQGLAPTQADDVQERWSVLLSRLRTNWLPPPRTPAVFRCHLQIEYRRGGAVTDVSLGEGCDDGVLGDSIVRAVWKTRILPLEPGSPADGHIELEFTP